LTNYAKIKRWMLKEGLSVIDLNWKTLGKVGRDRCREVDCLVGKPHVFEKAICLTKDNPSSCRGFRCGAKKLRRTQALSYRIPFLPAEWIRAIKDD